MLGRKPPVTFAARPGNVSVQRDTHLQDHTPHQNSFVRQVKPPRAAPEDRASPTVSPTSN